MFLDTYSAARAAFLSLAGSATRMTSYVLPDHLGIDGEVLATDVATFGNPHSPKALLVLCGTHGLEGAAGSAVQRAFITAAGALPPGVKIVAVHAVNPWGFSHASRSDQDNVDVNRNFVDFDQPLPWSEAYDRLHPLQCPDAWSDTTGETLRAALRAFVKDRGLGFLMDGLSAGQHQEPTGLNYGGANPTWSNLTIRQVVREEMGGCEKIGYVEWHTGIGEFAELFHVCLHPSGSQELDQAAAWWGRDVVTRNSAAYPGSNGVTPQWRGLLLRALADMAPQARVAGAVIEAGTYNNQRVHEGLMIDRWLRFGRENLSAHSREQLEAIKREIFLPSDEIWRGLILGRAVDAQMKALNGLSAW